MDNVQRDADEGGQATPLLALVIVVAAVMGAVVVGVGDRLVDRAKAQTAADAAALAGATGGRPAAQRFAALNDAELRSFEAAGPQVRVRVTVGRAEATARAERS